MTKEYELTVYLPGFVPEVDGEIPEDHFMTVLEAVRKYAESSFQRHLGVPDIEVRVWRAA
jgi:hypothetical protein